MRPFSLLVMVQAFVLLALAGGHLQALDVTLSKISVRERLPVGSVVGILSTDGGLPATYSLVAGVGDDDNARFTVLGRVLRTAEVFDSTFLTAASVRVSADNGSTSQEQSFAISVDPVVLGWVRGWGHAYTHENIQAWDPPDSLGQMQAIGCGYEIGFAIDPQGQVLSWRAGTAPSTALGVGDHIAVTGNFVTTAVLNLDGTVTVLTGAAPPVGLTDVTQIVAGEHFFAALRANGTVVTWGDGSTFPSVLTVPDGLDEVVEIAAGSEFVLALRADGTITGWGRDNISQATGGSALTGVKAISAGGEFGHAVLADGTVTGWGNSSFGRIDVPAGLNEVVDIVSAQPDTFAIRADGTLVAWGITYAEVRQIEDLPPELKQVIAVAAGRQPSLALHTMGVRPTTPTVSPLPAPEAQAAGLEIGILSSYDADGHAITFSMVESDHGLFAIGGGANDRIVTTVPLDYEHRRSHKIRIRVTDETGLFRESEYEVPVTPVSEFAPTSLTLTSTVIELPVFDGQTIGMFLANDPDADETFGFSLLDDAGGRFAIAADQLVLVDAFGLSAGDICQVTARVTDSGGLTLDRLFDLTVGDPVAPPAPPTNAGLIVLSRSSVDERLPAGSVVGILSDETTVDPVVFTLVDGPGGDGNGYFRIQGSILRTDRILLASDGLVRRIRVRSDDGTATREDACVVSVLPRRFGNVTTWGHDYSYNYSTPTQLGPVYAMSMAYNQAWTIRSDGSVVSWREGGVGTPPGPQQDSDIVKLDCQQRVKLALRSTGTLRDLGSEAPIPAGLARIVDIACGQHHAIALRDDGTVVLWGTNYTLPSTLIPPEGLDEVIAVAAGTNVTWALKADGTIVGWGTDNIGQASGGNALVGIAAISGGEEFAVAQKSDGTLVAWGNPNTERTAIPGGLGAVLDFDCGAGHSLALKGDGTVAAWGVPNDGATMVPAGLDQVFKVSGGRFASMALHRQGFTRTLTLTVIEGGSGKEGVRVSGGAEFAESTTNAGGTVQFSELSPELDHVYRFRDSAADMMIAPLSTD